jgi:hypothetical protein
MSEEPKTRFRKIGEGYEYDNQLVCIGLIKCTLKNKPEQNYSDKKNQIKEN